MKKQYLSWREIEQLCVALATKVREGGFAPDYLVGVALGGLVPLTLISRELGVTDVSVIRARSYDTNSHERKELVIDEFPDVDLSGKQVLLVDEIADSGETLKRVSELLRERSHAEVIKTATLVVHASHCSAAPDFSVMKTEEWVVFPWEADARR